MTQDEIIEMAKKCGFYEWRIKTPQDLLDVFAFAKLIAQHEREQCKKLCEWKTGNQFVDEAVAVCYRAIDLRGQA
jgi:adenylyl- and sulfurtransferase ThiI